MASQGASSDLERLLIPVYADQQSFRPDTFQHGPRMATETDSGIDKDAARPAIQEAHHLSRHDRRMIWLVAFHRVCPEGCS
jgi:hypothetical protein